MVMAYYAYRKYRNHTVEYNGLKFGSDKEFERYLFLLNMQKRGQISGLIVHEEFILLSPFSVSGKKFREIKYIADFSYTNADGEYIIEDVKGFETDVFKLKEKLFAAKYGKTITKVKYIRGRWTVVE